MTFTHLTMLARLVLLSLLCSSASALICPAGYNDGGDDACYKIYTTTGNFASASAQCKKDGGSLVKISNAFVNAAVLNNAGNLSPGIWIGLQCTGSFVTTCSYEDGTKLTTSSYSNFGPGYPSSGCVYMSTTGSSTGKWLTASCDSTSYAFECQYSGVESCPYGYSEFEGNCYAVLPKKLPTNDAELECSLKCGHLTSIVSRRENEFILALANKSASSVDLYARLGLVLNGTNNYLWLDGTVFTYDYINFGAIDSNLGSCIGMALTNDIIGAGQWINTRCESNMLSVCKVAKVAPCVPSSPLPTLTPQHCLNTNFLDGNGTIYSPGYPLNYLSNTCEYVIGVPSGHYVSVHFLASLLDPKSQIELYNEITDPKPFVIITQELPQNNHYQSTGSSMKVVFRSRQGAPETRDYKWVMEYEPALLAGGTTIDPLIPSGCNQGLRMAPSSLSSPHYPENYPANTKCAYTLGCIQGKRIFLTFENVVTDPTLDVISIYDGTDATAPLLGTVSGIHPMALTNFTSSSTRLFVQFTAKSTGDFIGFFGTFIAI